MTSSNSYVRPAPRAKLGQRGVATDHAALALAISSTAIFVLSALLAFLIAHDQLVARSKLTLMMVGLLLPLAFAVFARDRWETALATVAVACGFGAGMIGVTDIILHIGGDMGSAAGSLVALLPLAGIGLIWAWMRRTWALLAALIACVVLGLIALFISGENSAWIGFVLGVMLGMLLYWHFTVERYRSVLYLIEAVIVGLFILGLATYLLLLLAPEPAYARVASSLPQFYQDRLILWRSALPGIQDYVFTGSGLGNAAMVLSSYVYLLHVPYVFHVHNMYMEIFLEQGVAGLVGFFGMLIASLWSVVITLRQGNERYQRYAVCIGISLFSLSIAGLFESDVYAGQLVALMFLPFGFAWVLGEHAVVQRTVREPWTRKVRIRELAVGLVPVVILLVVAVLPGSRSQWFANLGAVAQARAELSQFRWPLWQIQDEMRRDEKIDLSGAEDLYNRALDANPDNLTALRRLGQIAVSRGDWQTAQSYLERAYVLDHGQNSIRQLLGEVYAVNGRIDEAAALWRTVDNRQQQLQARQWWYSYINDPAAVANVQAAIEESQK